ncbi:M28 family metallopeptidase [Halorarius litoreus]|uniref:M28 family metallopeptidase n=1 Tax=Halorarius litoreus TaxID=2962676 RepID=UPI0020CFCE46|nr:M20/M25/M40 family metallo-hydrolase [Halorarius litoreus]
MATEDYQLYERDEPGVSGVERTLYDAVSREEPWAMLERFATLRRVSPSADERAAADYIASRFDEYGVPYERYDPELRLSVPRAASVRVGDWEATGTEADFETDPPAVKAYAFSRSATVSGPAVHQDVPAGETLDARLAGTALDADLSGSVVVAEGVTAGHDANEFIRVMEARDAAGLVLVHPAADEPYSLTAAPVWGGVPQVGEPGRSSLVVLAVSRTVGDDLVDRLDDASDIEVSADLDEGWFECPIVVGTVPAERSADGRVLLHGHLDSWYYGVTDNATGNAGIVEVVRVLNEHRDRLRRDLTVAFWPGHEGGRYGGSTWFVDQFALELYDDCLAHVVFDSAGAKDATEFNSTYWMPEAAALCAGAIDDVAGKPSTGKRAPQAGDYSFSNLGITGLMALSSGIPEAVREARGYTYVGGCGGNAEAWHRSTDTLDKADPDVLQRDIRVYLLIVYRLLTRERPPLDYRATVARHREILDDYDERAGDHYALDQVRTELDALAEVVDQFYDALDADDLDAATGVTAMRTLSRRLVPVNYARRGRFEQDPPETIPPYPRLASCPTLDDLDGDDYRIELTRLRRAENAVAHELRQARRELEVVL